jgi:glycosyltransferase involved in cell wall biosynthesis
LRFGLEGRPPLEFMLKVSVITAVLNGLDAVKRTVDSVLEQTYPNVEYIIVDGASTDGTSEYLQSRQHEFAALRSECDRGAYDAFNKGLSLATGDVVGYLNAGDVFTDRDVLIRIMAPFSDPEIGAVFGDVAMIRDADMNHVVRRYGSNTFRPNRVRFGFMPAHPTLYMRRSVYELSGEYDPTFKIAGDYELVIRAFVKQRTNYRYIPEILVRMPVGGLSTRGWRSKWLITNEMRRACAKNGIHTNLLLLSLRFPVKLIQLLWHRSRFADG